MIAPAQKLSEKEEVECDNERFATAESSLAQHEIAVVLDKRRDLTLARGEEVFNFGRFHSRPILRKTLSGTRKERIIRVPVRSTPIKRTAPINTGLRVMT